VWVLLWSVLFFFCRISIHLLFLSLIKHTENSKKKRLCVWEDWLIISLFRLVFLFQTKENSNPKKKILVNNSLISQISIEYFARLRNWKRKRKVYGRRRFCRDTVTIENKVRSNLYFTYINQRKKECITHGQRTR